ncbi:MAG TPA: pyridoxal-phosphate dependent enzyme, partial [Gemmatimonadaceae bacterium]|nr:pyridoxal-phosphate dependent enzyme [Gemmatimonadaceae bacterium]
MSDKWKLECHACGWKTEGDALATVCQDCGQPLLVRHEDLRSPRESLAQSKRWDMWRYARQLPLHDGEAPVSLGEGGTPLINAPKLATAIGVTSVWVKDEGLNPTGSFKARGMSAAVTRAKAHNVPGLVVPTAG